VLHDRLYAGAGYRGGILSNDRLLDEALQPTEVRVDVHGDHRLIGSLDLDLYAQERREITGRLRQARHAPTHVPVAIYLLGIAGAHLTVPASLR